jgi:large subunit ribosomal protein L17
MRHNNAFRKLSRTHEHRRALLRNLVTALFEYERIETSVAKAKEARRFAERMITFAKRGDLAARREVASYVMKPAVTQKLFSTIAPWYTERPGGYTRIIKTRARLGDAGEMAILELVKSKEQKDKERKEAVEKAEAKGKKKEKKAAAKEKAPAPSDAVEPKRRRGKAADTGR